MKKKVNRFRTAGTTSIEERTSPMQVKDCALGPQVLCYNSLYSHAAAKHSIANLRSMSTASIAPLWVREYLPYMEDVNMIDIYGREGIHIEYKSSLTYVADGELNVSSQINKIMRNIAAFANAEGGTLFIGVRDDGSICGIEHDFWNLATHPDDCDHVYRNKEDGFENCLRCNIEEQLGMDAEDLCNIDFKTIDGKMICIITMQPADEPVWVYDKYLHVRKGNHSKLLRGKDAYEYCSKHWGRYNKTRVFNPNAQYIRTINNPLQIA